MYPAHSAGIHAWTLLSDGDDAAGTVFAVFKRTLYLQRTGSNQSPSLLCIGHRDLVDGPLNVRTALTDMSRFQIGQPWHCDHQTLTIADVQFDLSAAVLWHPPDAFTALKTNSPLSPCCDAVTTLSRLVTDDVYLTAIEKAVHERLAAESTNLLHWLKSTDADNFPVGLLGCGSGLTPAGDDILVGAMIALKQWHTPRFNRLSQQLRLVLGMPVQRQLQGQSQERTQKQKGRYPTSDISAAHLLAACDGVAIEPLHALVASLTSLRGALTSAHVHADTKQSVAQAAEALLGYGHSSGKYALHGVLLAARSVGN